MKGVTANAPNTAGQRLLSPFDSHDPLGSVSTVAPRGFSATLAVFMHR
jgi:hypothetical protein